MAIHVVSPAPFAAVKLGVRDQVRRHSSAEYVRVGAGGQRDGKGHRGRCRDECERHIFDGPMLPARAGGFVYVSGPMTGIERFNHPAFEYVSQKLRARGLVVVSPHELDRELASDKKPPSYGDYLGNDVRTLLDGVDGRSFEAIYLLPGWTRSGGSRLEAFVALERGVAFYRCEFGAGADFETYALDAGAARRLLSNPKDAPAGATANSLPTDSAARKTVPLYSGVIRYFAAALAGVARVSKEGNEKHNPGRPLQHSRTKSSDHRDCMVRHLVDLAENERRRDSAGPNPEDDAAVLNEARQMAWRALAELQLLEETIGGAPVAPAAT